MTDQTTLRAAILDPAAAVPPGLADGAGRPAGRRFSVYRNNVAVSLTEALEAAFPLIRKIVGETFFRAMAGVYLRAHPPGSPLMMFYGQQMPDFLASFPPVAHLPYLPDVARLELALRESYHAADAATLPPEALAALSPDALEAARLRLAPALRLIPSRYPLHDIWVVNRGNAAGIGATAQACLVTRPDFDPAVDPLSPGAAAILAALLAGTPLGAAAREGAAEDLPALLTLLISRRAIVALD